MALDNEQIVRNAYQIAEVRDIAGWVAARPRTVNSGSSPDGCDSHPHTTG
jgi:hypothetical protein